MTGEDELKLIGKNARFELSLPETGARELVPRGIAGGRMLADWRRLVVSATGRYLFRLRAETGPVRFELFAPNGRSLLRLQAEPAQRKKAAPSNWPAAPTRSPSSPTPPTQPPMRSWPQPPPDRSYGASARMREPLSGACGSGRPGSLPMRAGERRRAGARAPSFRAGKRTRPQRDSANSGSAAGTSGRSEFPE